MFPQKWGWVQEMYAFTIALYVSGVRHVDLVLHLMAQPPWDNRMALGKGKPYYILHYTYGNDFTLDGKHVPGARAGARFRAAGACCPSWRARLWRARERVLACLPARLAAF